MPLWNFVSGYIISFQPKGFCAKFVVLCLREALGSTKPQNLEIIQANALKNIRDSQKLCVDFSQFHKKKKKKKTYSEKSGLKNVM